jgi:hypothetical protein
MWIGNLPRGLLSKYDCCLIKIKPQDVRCGDFLFLKKKKKRRLITHLALVLETNKIFHCTKTSKRAQIVELECVFNDYEQVQDIEKLATYVDPRDDSYLVVDKPVEREAAVKECEAHDY